MIYAAANLPFAVWLMTSFIEQIPVELEECARTDGAGRIGVLVRIVLPLALPGSPRRRSSSRSSPGTSS